MPSVLITVVIFSETRSDYSFSPIRKINKIHYDSSSLELLKEATMNSDDNRLMLMNI